MTMKKINEFKKEDWFKLAVIVDKEYKGKEDVFEVINNKRHHTLSTDSVDNCNVIRVCFEDGLITKIVRIGPDVDSWTEVTQNTYERIRTGLDIETNLLTDDRKLVVQTALNEIEELKDQIKRKCRIIQKTMGGVLPESVEVEVAMEGPFIWDHRNDQYGYNATFPEIYTFLRENNRDHLKESDWSKLDDLPF